MSYTEYLNRLKINSPKVVDTQMRMPDASSFTWRTRLAAASVFRPTDHVITNVEDPSITPNLFPKQSMVYKGTGYGGKVVDASTYISTLGATSIAQDVFTGGRITEVCCGVLPPPSQIINENGNAQGSRAGLNMGYIRPAENVPLALRDCCSGPQAKSYFVDTIPEIKTHKIGVSSAQGPTRGTQLPITTCTDTFTHGAPQNADGTKLGKDEKSLNLHSPPAQKIDFLTAISGPQISENGAYGRAPKVGAALDSPKYSERHHGRAWGPAPVPSKYKPVSGAPAQKKINEPHHYHVA